MPSAVTTATRTSSPASAASAKTPTTPSKSGAGTEGLKIFEGFLAKRAAASPSSGASATASSSTTAGSPPAKRTAAPKASDVRKAIAGASAKKAGTAATTKCKAVAAASKIAQSKRLSFGRFPTKIRLLIFQQLLTERDILTFLQIEGSCRDILYLYPEAVFGRYRHVDDFPWIRAFPEKRDRMIRRSWHSSSGRWAVVQLEKRAPVSPAASPAIANAFSKQPDDKAAGLPPRQDSLLLDLKTKKLVTSRIVHPIPRHLSSSSSDQLRDWCDILTSSFSSDEKYVVTSSRRLTCVCECGKSTILAAKEHPPVSTFGEIEQSLVTRDGKYLVLIGGLQISIVLMRKPSEELAYINAPKWECQGKSTRRCYYSAHAEVLVIMTMGSLLECWDLSARFPRPRRTYHLTGPLLEPHHTLQPPEDPTGRTLLLAPRDGKSSAYLVHTRAALDTKNTRADEAESMPPTVLNHADLGAAKRWQYTSDGNWLLCLNDGCCQLIQRMWDLRSGVLTPIELDPKSVFKVKDGSIQYRGSVGKYLIGATLSNTQEFAERILVLNTATKAVKSVVIPGKQISRGCSGSWTISADGGCLATTCESRDEVWAWLVPSTTNSIPPQSQLANHRKSAALKSTIDQTGMVHMKRAKRLQRAQIDVRAASNEYFMVTNRNSVLAPAGPPRRFMQTMRDQAQSKTSLKLTTKTLEQLWETLRLLVLRTQYNALNLWHVDEKDVERLTAGLQKLSGVPKDFLFAAHAYIADDLLLRNPFQFRKEYAIQPGSGKASAASTSNKTSKAVQKRAALPASTSRASPSASTVSVGSSAGVDRPLLNMLDSTSSIKQSLWLHRPSLHLLGKTAVIELLMEDYVSAKEHNVWFSEDGNWALGGTRIYNVEQAYSLLSARESVENECLDAVDRLTDILDRLACPCKNCTDITSSLTALMNSGPIV